MRKLKKIYRDYLKKIGKLDGELRLGRQGDTEGVENEALLISEAGLLQQRLDRRFQFNNKIIILAIVLLCILFFIGVYLVFYYRDEPQIMGGIFGGTFVSLLSIVKWLHILWKEKSVMDLSIVFFEELPPKEAAEKASEFIPLLYKKIRGSSKEPKKRRKPKKKILILSANPITTPRLRLDKEISDSEESILRSRYRDQFDIQAKLAVGFREFRRALLDYNPDIVHFIGHGSGNGLLVVDELGMAVSISTKALSGLFEKFSDQVECVILSACFSAPQVAAISKHIDYVIGMRKEIEDKAAIEFAVGFYDALGAGKAVEESFEFGRNAVQLFNIPGHLVPVLKKRQLPYIQNKGGDKDGI